LNDSFLKRTVDMWQPYSEKKLSEEDAREIIRNLAGFLDLLAEWDRRDKQLESESRVKAEKAHELIKTE